jgi:small subunit ribosomal protein S6
MPFYENVFITRQEMSTAQVEALAGQFSETVKSFGGEVVKTEMWGLRNLTYRIKKNRKGHYVMLGLSTEPAAITELERLQRINEDVIRFLTIRVEAIGTEPSAILAVSRDRDRPDRGRDDRPRRRDFGDAGAPARAQVETTAPARVQVETSPTGEPS